MTGRLEGRVAIVTGAGRGLGRSHALALAAEGAAVVVNDLGGDVHGDGADPTPAQEVVALIEGTGGSAIASGHDVSDWDAAAELVQMAIDTFGDLHVLVNNAGVVRDRTLANMSEADWDTVLAVHLKGSAAPTRHALAWWRAEAKTGRKQDRSVVMTTSAAGFAGNFGQANYSAAKAALLALSRVVSLENGPHGVRSNAVSPGARTRIALSVPGAEDELRVEPGVFDPYAPERVSPLIVWLAQSTCPANAQIFHITGERLIVSAMPAVVHDLHAAGGWTVDGLDAALPPHLVPPASVTTWVGDPTDSAVPAS